MCSIIKDFLNGMNDLTFLSSIEVIHFHQNNIKVCQNYWNALFVYVNSIEPIRSPSSFSKAMKSCFLHRLSKVSGANLEVYILHNRSYTVSFFNYFNQYKKSKTNVVIDRQTSKRSEKFSKIVQDQAILENVIVNDPTNLDSDETDDQYSDSSQDEHSATESLDLAISDELEEEDLSQILCDKQHVHDDITCYPYRNPDNKPVELVDTNDWIHEEHSKNIFGMTRTVFQVSNAGPSYQAEIQHRSQHTPPPVNRAPTPESPIDLNEIEFASDSEED